MTGCSGRVQLWEEELPSPTVSVGYGSCLHTVSLYYCMPGRLSCTHCLQGSLLERNRCNVQAESHGILSCRVYPKRPSLQSMYEWLAEGRGNVTVYWSHMPSFPGSLRFFIERRYQHRVTYMPLPCLTQIYLYLTSFRLRFASIVLYDAFRAMSL